MPPTKTWKKQWERVLSALQREIGAKRFDLWMRKTELESFSEDRLRILTPNVFVKEWLSSHYKSQIARHVFDVTGLKPRIDFVVDVSLAKPIKGLKPETGPPKTKTRTLQRLTRSQIFHLNNDFRLDNFIVGSCNRLAFHAAERISRKLNSRFNPFFVYGGCGLGKTHLLQAITRELTRNLPDKKVLYISSEYFVNSFIQAVKSPADLTHFRRRFRDLDALVVDDVHILGGKERTQEEFLHTFNATWDRNTQIVMASDSHPRALKRLRAELIDRFSGGLITELKLPSFQTRLNILRRKAEEFDVNVPPKVLSFLARKLEDNVRVLEGALNAIVAHALFTKREVTMDLAWLTIKELARKKAAPLSLEEVENLVIAKFSVSSKDLHSKSRSRRILVPRQVCMYLARKFTRYSLSDIGRYFSGRNHSVVLHAEKRVEELLKKDGKVRDVVREITENLG
jgi:chromosomal replication initiator protein